MEEQRTCTVCGCPLGAADVSCPVCGAVNEPRPATGPRHAAPESKPKFKLKLKRVAAVAVAVVAVAVIVAAVFVVRAWQADRALSERAVGASGGAAPATAADTGGATGASAAGNVAAGGIAVADSAMLYGVGSQSVFCWDLRAETGDGYRMVSTQGGYGLNVYDGRAYYLVPAAGGRDRFEGLSVQSLDCASDTTDGPQRATGEYAPKSAEVRLSCLTVADGVCYFLERTGTAYSIMSYVPGSGAAADALFAFEAGRAWLFAEGGALYLVRCANGAWSAGRAGPAADALSFTELAHGSGDLAAVALNGGRFYYAYASDGGEARLQCSDLRGGVFEFADVVNPVRIAAAGDVVAVITKSGGLVWVDAVTGVSHDMTGKLGSALPNLVPTAAALGVAGDFICVADDKGGYCRLNVGGAGAGSAK